MTTNANPTLEHGRPGRYRAGCRCDLCHGNYLRKQKAYRLRSRVEFINGNAHPTVPQRVTAEPIRAHIHALVASGWSHTAIATEAACSQGTVSDIARGRFRRVHRPVAERILAVEPLAPVDYDPVVVDRLIAGGDWKSLHATRAERIAAAERLWHHWRPIRERQHADGTAPQWLDGPSLTDIERRFSLRAGRDFRRTPDETPTRGAA